MTFWRDDSGQIVRRMNAPRAFIVEPLRVDRDLIAGEYPFLKAHALGREQHVWHLEIVARVDDQVSQTASAPTLSATTSAENDSARLIRMPTRMFGSAALR